VVFAISCVAAVYNYYYILCCCNAVFEKYNNIIIAAEQYVTRSASSLVAFKKIVCTATPRLGHCTSVIYNIIITRKEKKRKKTIIIISQQPRFHVEIRRTWRRRVSSGNAIRHYTILHLKTTDDEVFERAGEIAQTSRRRRSYRSKSITT